MEEIGIESDSLAAILAGTKTTEGRLAKPQFVSLRVGMKFRFVRIYTKTRKLWGGVPMHRQL